MLAMGRMGAFACWLTGLPASGKSSIAKELAARLRAAGVEIEVLESDVLRRVLTPAATYAPEERDLFYRALVFTASRLVAHGTSCIIDATANRRAYRDLGREWIPRLFEVWVDCPLEVCVARDYKGTYQKARSGQSSTVPGAGAEWEPPLRADLHVDTTVESPEAIADRIVTALGERGLLDEG